MAVLAVFTLGLLGWCSDHRSMERLDSKQNAAQETMNSHQSEENSLDILTDLPPSYEDTQQSWEPFGPHLFICQARRSDGARRIQCSTAEKKKQPSPDIFFTCTFQPRSIEYGRASLT
ncbi:hypothetical protein AUEXF2481DRAFT_8510 [Aureobasidium subglaciale EXF-2481]|uniref:Ig-like domain-containing protein n=1 Tax=Aureobasidium subglaciale (strain EXF-2481) TaxID=1043005 RepID=A0A074Y129_AURSE|nr:uncharacterized protein AUEXF2481DRAFT_8510 [Aureobasidium subglaciale EXF-2481]KEQ91440.1 hypothetical protein AUEXF2481DRAFT_8510 [Aureobasidium subglaciale EXF-2481]